MPAATGHVSGITCPALSALNSFEKNSFVAAAAPVVAQSFKTTLPALPGAMQIKVAQIPRAALMTCAAVMLIALLTPPGNPGATFTGPMAVAGICDSLCYKSAGTAVN